MRQTTPAKTIAPMLLAAAFHLCAAVLCAQLSGCQLVGAVVAKTQGPAKIEALYVPRKVPTLILSEHAAGASVDDVSAEDIGRRVAEFWSGLMLSPLIDLSQLEQYRQEHPDTYYKMSTVAIGRALGAEQVVYIDVRDNHDEAAGGSDTIRATAAARVRVVDVATGETLWPPDAAKGYSLDAQTQFQAREEGVSESAQMQQVREMLSNKIIKLFYQHMPDDDGTPE